MIGPRPLTGAMDDANMTSVRKAILAKIESRWQTTTCRSNKCSIDMDNAPEPFHMINMDRLAPRDLEDMGGRLKRCDYLYLCTPASGVDVVIVPIELKGGAFRPVEVVQQLQGGADVADAIVPSDVSFRFVPVLASHFPRRRHVWRGLRKPVVFRDERHATTTIQCDERLTTALEKARRRSVGGGARS